MFTERFLVTCFVHISKSYNENRLVIISFLCPFQIQSHELYCSKLKGSNDIKDFLGTAEQS